MGHLGKQYVFIALFCAFLAVGINAAIPRACAGGAGEIKPGCDEEYMDAMEARAWLQGQRRISQNQNLVFKNDSVIEYSCFNQLLGWLAAKPGARRFSENDPPYPTWPSVANVDTQSLDTALLNMVNAPMEMHLQNFGHTFLGGRTVDAGGTGIPWGQYDCQAMQYVWERARCMDFIEDDSGKYILGDDDFYDFAWYEKNDPRRIPAEYEVCKVRQQIQPGIVEMYRGEGQDKKHGDEYERFVLSTENNPYINDGTVYEEDAIPSSAILDLVLPDECEKSAVIPTGVMIKIPDEREHQEFFCTMPSCSYDGSQCVE